MIDFELDQFQLDAIAGIDEGHNVVVAAPTGSGKTVVAEAAIEIALRSGARAFYTTPIKALSNQKYRDLVALWGPERVGLLTGDRVVRPDADVVVMTTEVLRNMVYAESSQLDRLAVVILDEIHFLQDAYRGPVWEEVIIGLDHRVKLVCLSATVSNIEELGDWIRELRGHTRVVTSTQRPVVLDTLYAYQDRRHRALQLLAMLIDGSPNPRGEHLGGNPRSNRRSDQGQRKLGTPRRGELLDHMVHQAMTPAIWFVFSRKGCDVAAAQLRDLGHSYTSRAQRLQIEQLADLDHCDLDAVDRQAIGFDDWYDALIHGIGVHHAGLIPLCKEIVERCFLAGLLTVVFATETLALGINMPARSVVIDKVSKFTGDGHETLTPAQFTQLTGRAGRRGIDEVGYAIVQRNPFISFQSVAQLAASTSFPLRSAFRPTYNMTANMIARFDRSRALEVLGQSFAQFQADRDVVRLNKSLRDSQRAEQHWREQAQCEHGDLENYLDVLERFERLKTTRGASPARIGEALALLRPGDVIAQFVMTNATDREWLEACVLGVSTRKSTVRIKVVDKTGQLFYFEEADFEVPPYRLTSIELPEPYAPNSSVFLDEVAVRLSALGGFDELKATSPVVADPYHDARDQVLAHPVHRCRDLDRHLYAHKKLRAIEAKRQRSERTAMSATNSVAHQFERVRNVLQASEMANGWALTEAGVALTGIYHERDLAIASALAEGVFDDLTPQELAATLSYFTYDPRRFDAAHACAPTQRLAERLRAATRVVRKLNRLEQDHGLGGTTELSAGFAEAALAWAGGAALSEVMSEPINVHEWLAGDFVRSVRVLIDVARQLSHAAPNPSVRSCAAQLPALLERGIVSDTERGPE